MILSDMSWKRATLPDHAGFFVWLAASMEVIVVLAEMETMLYGPPCRTMFLLPFSRRQIVSALLMTKGLLAERRPSCSLSRCCAFANRLRIW